jgi:zinc protease
MTSGALALIFLMAAVPQEEPLQVEDLPGGARLVIQARPGCGTFALQILSAGGSIEDPDDDLGLTAVLSRLLLSGTARRDRAAQALEVERTGSRIERVSEPGAFGLRASGPAAGFETALDVAVDAWRSPRLADEDLRREAALERQALRVALDDPSSAFERAMRPLVFGSHPLGRVSDPETFLTGLTRDEMARAHAARCVGRRTTLAIVGDVDPDRAARLARAALAGMPEGDPFSPPDPPAPLAREARARVGVRTTEPLLFVGLPTGGLAVKDWPVMDVLAHILGGTEERLFGEIREKRGWAYWVSPVDRRYRAAGLFGVLTAVPARRLDEAEDIIRQEMERIAAHPPEEAEMERARRILGTGLARSWQRSEVRAASFAFREVRGLPAATARSRWDELAAVTPGQVSELARRLIEASRPAVVTVK